MSDEDAQAPESPAADGPAPGGRPAPDEPEFPAAEPPGPTGDPRVDAAMARLGELGARPVSEHVEIYEDVHRRLQELLASADQDERSPAPRPAFPDALRPRP